MEDLDLFDSKRAVRIAGTRAFFTKNDLVLLEYAVLTHALKHMVLKGFTPLTVPWMVNEDAMWGTGLFSLGTGGSLSHPGRSDPHWHRRSLPSPPIGKTKF